MTIEERIAAGDGSGAIASLEAEVLARPDDPTPRAGLFALRVILGDRAGAASELDALDRIGGVGMVGRWTKLLAAEVQRDRVIRLEAEPQILGESRGAGEATWRAWQHLGRGEVQLAREALEAFEAGRTPLKGRIGPGTSDWPFDRFFDADDLIGAILEIHGPDGYGWVAWDEVRYLDVRPSKSILDAFWTPARLALASGMIGSVVLPGFYPGTDRHADERVRLGLRDDWAELGSGLTRGFGRKLFDVGGQPTELAGLVNLRFEPPGEEAPE